MTVLDELHRAAGRPSARRVSQRIADGPYPDMVGHDTVRRTLDGDVIPRWDTVRSIVAVLTELCGPPRDPDTEVGRVQPLWRATREHGSRGGGRAAEKPAGASINPFHAVRLDPALASGAERGAPVGRRDPGREMSDAPDAFAYACEQIRRRLRAEPGLLARSIEAFHTDPAVGQKERDEVLWAETDDSLVREVMAVTPETWHEASEEARWLMFAYLVAEATTLDGVDRPAGRRFRITWRVPEPASD